MFERQLAESERQLLEVCGPRTGENQLNSWPWPHFDLLLTSITHLLNLFFQRIAHISFIFYLLMLNLIWCVKYYFDELSTLSSLRPHALLNMYSLLLFSCYFMTIVIFAPWFLLSYRESKAKLGRKIKIESFTFVPYYKPI